MQFKFLFLVSIVQAGLTDIDLRQMLFQLKEKKLGVMLNVSYTDFDFLLFHTKFSSDLTFTF